MNEKNPPEKTALEDRAIKGARMFSPSAARNRDAILDVFLAHMPQAGAVLEIASGSGEHGAHIAAHLSDLTWLPGDPDETCRASIAAWIAHEGLENIRAPHAIDVTEKDWAKIVAEPVSAVVSINMVHIAPFDAAEGLIAGAGELLQAGGKLFLYGPFSRDGAHSAPSNAAFDETLKSRDPRWGVRDLERDILPLTEKAGFDLETVVAMPANNLSVIFVRR